MRLAVDGGGYATARTAFENANHVAALQYDAMSGKLAGYAAMAGDDASSAEFAAAYDDAASQATGALADLVAAYPASLPLRASYCRAATWLAFSKAVRAVA